MALTVNPQALAAAATPGGYAWWYLDAVVEDQQSGQGYALTIILFAGAVFSPTYAARSRAGAPDRGVDHPAVNVALSRLDPGPADHSRRRGKQIAWAMNEHPAAALTCTADSVRIGASELRYLPGADASGAAASIVLEEEQTRFGPQAGPVLRGALRLFPELPALPPQEIGRSPDGREVHHWQPVAARARVEGTLTLDGQTLHLRGSGYHDSNFGGGRLERTFARWAWAHATAPTAAAVPDELILYRTTLLDGSGRSLALRLSPTGSQCQNQPTSPESPSLDEPPRAATAHPGRFLWLSAPAAFSAHGYRCARRPHSRLVDAPFYARFEVTISPPGSDPAQGGYPGIGEYLDLTRFRSRVVQFLLGYKTRRLTAARVLPPGQGETP